MDNSAIMKTVPIIRDFSLNPSCHHGPTILFERDGKRFFTCSAFRSRKLCPFYMSEEQWDVSKSEETKAGHQRAQKRSTDSLLEETLLSKKTKTETVPPANHPLSHPNQRDKGEAQYHFNEKTVQYFMDHFRSLEFDSVLCVGTPSLHQHVTSSNQKGLKSFLLDIDDRFVNLYQPRFALYNMCNHHFFRESSKYHKFLASAKKLAIVVDPPFGVKVELIWHGCLSGIIKDFKKTEEKPDNNKADIFWIFPYFMEGHILSRCPKSSLEMSDFHVEYRNHTKYSGGPRSKSSPIRVFTTVPLSKITLTEDDYRYCDICCKWVDKYNLHCISCGTCTTKDGGKSYVHCTKCEKCVKPTWKHCGKCQKCHLADSLGACTDNLNINRHAKDLSKLLKNKPRKSFNGKRNSFQSKAIPGGGGRNSIRIKKRQQQNKT